MIAYVQGQCQQKIVLNQMDHPVISAHLRDGGADKNAGDDDVKSRAGDALGGVAGDGECGERSARRVRDGGDADESAPRPPIPARHHHGVLLEKSVFVCEWIGD